MLADEIADSIQKGKVTQAKKLKVEFFSWTPSWLRRWPKEIFKPGNQGTWISNIMDFSAQIPGPMDQINAFFNGANVYNFTCRGYSCRSFRNVPGSRGLFL